MAGILFQGAFRAYAKRQLVPGSWYVGFACVACRYRFALIDDPTNSGAVATGGDATIDIECAQCGERGVYDASALVLFQAPIGGVAALPEVETEPARAMPKRRI